jgi:ferritin-like metal-binding protein YciE
MYNGEPMKIHNLHSLFVNELKDAYDFEHQLLEALPKMAESAHDEELQKGFREHLKQTRGQVAQLERVFSGLGEKPRRKTCKGMKGLIKEGDQFMKARGDEAAVDAALVGAAQRVEHYEMAAYGTLRAFAQTLGHPREAKILQGILEQEVQADKRLSEIAKSRINPRAANGCGGGTERVRARRQSRESGGEPTRDELYQRAQGLEIEGRSKMDKQQLRKAVKDHS